MITIPSYKNNKRGKFHAARPDWVQSGLAICGAEIRNPGWAATKDWADLPVKLLCAKCRQLHPATERLISGYDGHTFRVGDRVELHPGCDLWMRGARFGTVIGLSLTRGDRVKVQLDKHGPRLFSAPVDDNGHCDRLRKT